MTTALALPNAGLPAPSEWQTMLGMADVLVKGGLLPSSIRSSQAALTVMLKARELGIPPLYGLSNIAVIEGKPTAGAELMLALIYRDHGDDAVRFVESSGARCTVSYKRRGWANRETYAFTLEDAQRAKVSGKDTWQKYPAAMLRARCVSAVARMAFPDTIGGLYTPEEMGAEVDEDGNPLSSQIRVDVETGEIHEPPARAQLPPGSPSAVAIAAQTPAPSAKMAPRAMLEEATALLRKCEEQIDPNFGPPKNREEATVREWMAQASALLAKAKREDVPFERTREEAESEEAWDALKDATEAPQGARLLDVPVERTDKLWKEVRAMERRLTDLRLDPPTPGQKARDDDLRDWLRTSDTRAEEEEENQRQRALAAQGKAR